MLRNVGRVNSWLSLFTQEGQKKRGKGVCQSDSNKPVCLECRVSENEVRISVVYKPTTLPLSSQEAQEHETHNPERASFPDSLGGPPAILSINLPSLPKAATEVDLLL